jgi:DNA-binding LacI/PurR family transcriptional regulator
MTTQLKSPKKFKYEDVKSNIGLIIDKMLPGSKMPSERHLARSNQCNMQTVRKALSLLADEGLVERRVGAGTFVANPNQVTPLTRHMGILLHDQADSYAIRISGNLSNSAREKNITLHTQLISDFHDSADHAIKQLAKDDCPCAIVPWLPADQTHQLGELVRRSPIPLSVPVALPGLDNHYFSDPRTFGVSGSRYTKLAGEYLHQLGHNVIAYVGPLLHDNVFLERRIIGYTLFCAEHELDNQCHLVSREVGRMDRLAQHLAQHRGSLGVICYDDEHAIRLMTAMHKLGLGAPKDFAILGWNNTSAAQTTDPPLSSFYGDYEHPANWMLKNAIGLAHGKVIQEQNAKPMYLKIRDSCGGSLRTPSELDELLTQIGLSKKTHKGQDHE